jgi:hypothetical protein
MSSMPLVSVIMPVYNGEKYIRPAVESILNQSFTEFEFIIIDDGSTDATATILDEYSDPRLIRLCQSTNQGYVYALNWGLAMARGAFIARQDADDISHPNRLALQIEQLQQRAEIVLIGAAYHTINEEGAHLKTYWPPTDDTSIRWQILFQNSFVHTAVMFRAAIIHQHNLSYNPELMPSEDYALWSQMLTYGQGANLAVPLVQYRRHSQQVSNTRSIRQKAAADRIAHTNLEQLGFTLTEKELRVLRDWQFKFPRPLDTNEMAMLRRSLSILNRFSQQQAVDSTRMRSLRCRWIKHIISHTSIATQWQELWYSGLFLSMLQEDSTTTLRSLVDQVLSRIRKRTGLEKRHKVEYDNNAIGF